MKLNFLSKAVAAGVLTLLVCSVSIGQWLHYPTPGTPRLPDGKSNLAAPAPRAPDGKPDLSGLWRGAGPRYRFNIAQDLKPEEVQPWAEALFLQRVRDIAPAGTLRVTFLGGNPTQGKVDPKTGAVSGPVKDLSEELGRKLRVPVSVTPLNGVPAVLESLKTHTADIGFAAIDPTRATEVDFSQPYLLGWSSYIVPVGSALRSVKDVDRPGVRVAANAGDAPDLFLARNLKNATLTHLKSMDEVLAALARGEIAGYATNRQRLLQIVAGDSRFRVLEGNFFAVEQAIAVPKGNAAALETVNQFLDDAKASGFLRGVIDRAGLAAAVDPAPPRQVKNR